MTSLVNWAWRNPTASPPRTSTLAMRGSCSTREPIVAREGRRGPDPVHQRGEGGVRRSGTPGNPVENFLVRLVEQSLKILTRSIIHIAADGFEKPAENQVHLAGAPPATPLKPSHERHAVSRQSWRTTIIFLIWAIAFAGLSPFGQARVQFMMVWQR